MIGIRLIVVTIATNGVAIVLALLQYKYYALVIQSVLSALFVFLWNLKNVKLQLRIKIDFNVIKKIAEYSGYQFGFSFINYFARNLDNLIIGKVWGNVILAHYDKAYRFMMYPIHHLTYVIGSFLHPILSEDQENKDYIYNRYMKIVKLLSLVGVFISAFCFWASQEIIIVVFGDQWYEAASCFRWLSLSIWAQMVASSAGSIYQSIGNTKLMFISGMIHVSISIIAIITGILSGSLNNFAICVSIGFFIKFFVEYFFLIKKGFQKKMVCFLYSFVPDVVIFILLFAGLFFFSYYMNMTEFSMIILLFCKLAFAVILYFCCLVLTKQWKYVKSIMKKGKRAQ
jgi:PST family polysaccharide transporter